MIEASRSIAAENRIRWRDNRSTARAHSKTAPRLTRGGGVRVWECEGGEGWGSKSKKKIERGAVRDGTKWSLTRDSKYTESMQKAAQIQRRWSVTKGCGVGKFRSKRAASRVTRDVIYERARTAVTQKAQRSTSSADESHDVDGAHRRRLVIHGSILDALL